MTPQEFVVDNRIPATPRGAVIAGSKLRGNVRLAAAVPGRYFLSVFRRPQHRLVRHRRLATGVYTMPKFLERRYSARTRWLLSLVSLAAYVFTKVSVSAEDRRLNRASWNRVDVLMTVTVLGLVLGMYLYFSFWLR